MRLACFICGLLLSSAAYGQSANVIAPWCREPGNDATLIQAHQYGHCLGAVQALIMVSQILRPPFNFCAPADYSHGQAIEIILQYIDDRPSFTHKGFEQLAVYALVEAWPCKK